MTFKLSLLPLSETFTLEYEALKGASITILQARTGEDTEMDSRFQKRESYWVSNGDGTMRRVEQYSVADLERWRYMVYCTLSAFDVVDEQTGKPLFTFTHDGNYDRLSDFAAFKAVWDRLPVGLASEIIELVWRVNPHWHPNYGMNVPAPAKTEGESDATTSLSENE